MLRKEDNFLYVLNKNGCQLLNVKRDFLCILK